LDRSWNAIRSFFAICSQPTKENTHAPQNEFR
jgi:hypothetical protein